VNMNAAMQYSSKCKLLPVAAVHCSSSSKATLHASGPARAPQLNKRTAEQRMPKAHSCMDKHVTPTAASRMAAPPKQSVCAHTHTHHILPRVQRMHTPQRRLSLFEAGPGAWHGWAEQQRLQSWYTCTKAHHVTQKKKAIVKHTQRPSLQAPPTGISWAAQSNDAVQRTPPRHTPPGSPLRCRSCSAAALRLPHARVGQAGCGACGPQGRW